ncbi:MmcQ/YjbR family DNA-binding protein [Candidatus Saccharibacteria bacterium]|nr:MmcQ/YjbR family DNA-binding protein [Candidatus Saccharibacteria bacterium]
MNVSAISGIGAYTESQDKDRKLYKKNDRVFLVEHKNTIELRTDQELKNLLTEKYESVMESRYFGRGGIEIVLAGYQLSDDELADLVRLSYNLS